MSRIDLDSFLQQGYWQNSRARSPDNRSYDQELLPSSRAYVYQDPTAPRWLPSTAPLPRRRLPTPTVEDEVESLAREYGSDLSALSLTDEVPNRGDIDQESLLEDVEPIPPKVPEHGPEHKPENNDRRFVLVSNSSDPSSTTAEKPKQDTKRHSRRESYSPPAPPHKEFKINVSDKEAPRKQDTTRSSAYSLKPEPLHVQSDEQRNRSDRPPPIVTDVPPEPPVHDYKRSKSAMGIKNETSEYQSPRDREREDQKLSPETPRAAAKSRERVDRRWEERLDRTSERRAPAPEDSYSRRAPLGPRLREEARTDSLKPPLSVNPGLEKRHSAHDIPITKPTSSRQSPERVVDRSTTDRKPPVSPHKKQTSRDSSYEKPYDRRGDRENSSARDWDTSEEESRRRGDIRRRQKPVIVDERVEKPDRSEFVGPRPETKTTMDKGRYRSRDLPTHSPRVSKSQIFDNESPPSRNSTFPRDPKSSDDERYAPIPPHRSSTTRGTSGPASSIAIPAIIAAATAASVPSDRDSSTPIDRRNPSVLPPPRVPASARSSSSTLSSSPPKTSYQPPKFDPIRNGVALEQKFSNHRRLSEDVRSGDLPDITDCPRTVEAAGHMDWLTLPRCDNFNICPTCYQNVFSHTEFATLFTPAPFRPRDRPFKCDFGTSQWYHIAWLLTLKYRKADMSLLHNIATVGSRAQACPGFSETYRTWHSIKDPSTGRMVSSFKICSHCANTISVLLPNLQGAFPQAESEPSTGMCLMNPAADRKRFLLYFDLMETASDRALATNSTVDMKRLANKIRELSRLPECRGPQLVQNARWHTMRSVPQFKVCEECFEDVVQPLLERGESISFVGNFHSEPLRIQGQCNCQLYSARMREIFNKAIRRKDFDYLNMRVAERLSKEAEIFGRMAFLKQQGVDANSMEFVRLLQDWRKFE